MTELIRPSVRLVAHTVFKDLAAEHATNWTSHGRRDDHDADLLAEFAGRACYQSWDRPNPETATNKGYLANILAHEHFTVLEHASATFLVKGVSRSFSHELVRHRIASYSQLSQRYVGEEHIRFVPPTAWRDKMLESGWTPAQVQEQWDGYNADAPFFYAGMLQEMKHLPHKQAREAARSVLPNCTETQIVVTMNMASWRHFLQKRWNSHADAEIAEVAGLIRQELLHLAPNTFQDVPEEKYS